MREIKRIHRICKKLEKMWSKVPDQRLGQFLSNYVYGHKVDIFNLDDVQVEDALQDTVGICTKVCTNKDLLCDRCIQFSCYANKKESVKRHKKYMKVFKEYE